MKTLEEIELCISEVMTACGCHSQEIASEIAFLIYDNYTGDIDADDMLRIYEQLYRADRVEYDFYYRLHDIDSELIDELSSRAKRAGMPVWRTGKHKIETADIAVRYILSKLK